MKFLKEHIWQLVLALVIVYPMYLFLDDKMNIILDKICEPMFGGLFLDPNSIYCNNQSLLLHLRINKTVFLIGEVCLSFLFSYLLVWLITTVVVTAEYLDNKKRLAKSKNRK